MIISCFPMQENRLKLGGTMLRRYLVPRRFSALN